MAIFSEGGFELHQWHSYIKEVEKEGSIDELTYAKEQLGTTVLLILPVVICLSQRLSHACLSIRTCTVKLLMAH